jgi:hypothetical protein
LKVAATAATAVNQTCHARYVMRVGHVLMMMMVMLLLMQVVMLL